MTPEEVRASGAMPRDFKASDLPPKTTYRSKVAPIWYFMAKYLAPEQGHHTEQAAWIEGFVAGMEAAGGLCGDASVTSALRDSLGLETAK